MFLKGDGYVLLATFWLEINKKGALFKIVSDKFGILPSGIIPYTAGDIYKIDVYADHSVKNESNEARYHLVFQEKKLHRVALQVLES